MNISKQSNTGKRQENPIFVIFIFLKGQGTKAFFIFILLILRLFILNVGARVLKYLFIVLFLVVS